MKHLGDIAKIDGHTAPWVDCIIGGSPCQDLSIAGKRAGLAGARSGLFMEQIRLIKEMREASGATYPRFMVWENVPGAFSSNKGRDFAAVLEETVKIVEPEAPPIAVPDKGWPTWGSIRDVDGRWSVAWRTLDAQYWGVPQRRRRIALVADFGGCTAAEILFERKSLFGNFAESRTARERPAGEVENGADGAIYCLQGNGIDRANTAGCNGKGWREDQSYTLNTIDRPAVYDTRGNGDGNTVPTITGDHESRVTDYTAITFPCSQFGRYTEGDKEHTLAARDYKSATDLIVRQQVRRLTPLECERLQGFPGGWTDIGEWVDTKGKRHKESSDAARYKALGNSIALPPWRFVLYRLCMQLGKVGTMASLFDGIGGFPLIWEQINEKGSCLWASEVENFCIAVTKRRFGE